MTKGMALIALWWLPALFLLVGLRVPLLREMPLMPHAYIIPVRPQRCAHFSRSRPCRTTCSPLNLEVSEDLLAQEVKLGEVGTVVHYIFGLDVIVKVFENEYYKILDTFAYTIYLIRYTSKIIK